MKFFTATVVLGLASIATSADIMTDYWDNYDAADVAPSDCASPTAFFSCYKPVTAYETCSALDDACNCSSVKIEENCISKHCSNLTFDTYGSDLWCTGTATLGSGSSKSTPTPKSDTPSSSTATTTAAPAAQVTDATAQATSTSTATSKPNGAGRSVAMSAGALLALVAAVAIL